MHRAVDDLAGVLEQQIKNYRELKNLMLEKRKTIVANDLQKLSSVTSQIQALVAANNRLETGRVSLVKKLATELNLSTSKPTLTQIARRLENPLSEKLTELRCQATDAITEVERQNRINSEMLKYNTNLLDSVIRLIVNPDPHDATYGSSGQANRRAASVSLLDHQV